MVGMVCGLQMGKKMLTMGALFGQDEVAQNTFSPRFVYFLSSSLYALSLISFTLVENYEDAFIFYALMIGFMGGFFAGTGYQAPMLSC